MNVFTNLLRQVPKVSNNIGRYYARGNFSIEWTRPKRVSCILPEKSGDLGLNIKIDPKAPSPKYKDILDQKNEDEIVKKMFSLEFNSHKDTAQFKLEEILSMVQRYKGDTTSMESIIAKMTSRIHNLQESMESNPRNKQLKKSLKELIDKRKKFLKRLRTWDYKRFEWLIEKLNLIYKPSAETFYKVTRKASIRKIAKLHCSEIKKERLEAYKIELKSQQKDFYLRKAEQLAVIREEEIVCGLNPTVTEEDIENAKKVAESL